jgi:Tol biopolymer transport system component
MSYPIASRVVSVAAALLLAAVLTACSDSVAPPPHTPVASVLVSPPATSLTVGQQVTLEATPKAADGEELERPVQWTSENETLATVSAAGLVTTLGAGEVGIRASSEGQAGRAVITILPITPVPVAEVRLSVDAEIVLTWDGETTISAVALDAHGNVLEGRSIQWHTTKPSVVAVNHGALYAIRPGSAIVSAISEGKAASVGVRVLEPPIESIEIEGSTGLETGEVVGFASKVMRANGETLYEPVSWYSSAPGIISVDYQDLWGATLAAHAEGAATITASRDGISATVTLRVTPRATHDLIFNKWTGPNSEIFTLSLGVDGSVPVRLNAGNVSREPSPSPDGTQYVFSVRQLLPTGEWQNDLYIVNRNGMNMRWLTRVSGIEDQPEWSPDGTKILFRGIAFETSDLFLINVDGTGLTNLTAGLPATMTDKRDPTWSRDGTRIAFIGAIAGQHKVWVMDADGSNARQVTTDAGFDMTPTFSPDGQRIAFTRYNAQLPALGDDVMIVSVVGGAATRLALAGDQRTPAWSPDGYYIAVSGSPVAGTGTSEIYTLRPDGTGLRLRTVNPAWGGGSNPAWIRR